MTPRALIRAWEKRFAEAGIEDAATDAALLLSHVTGKRPLDLRLGFDELNENDIAAFTALAEQRLTRIPLQYLLGDAPFMGRSFRVDSRVLIPRPETELLAEKAIAALKKRGNRALDLCCGSGCLGITLALEVPQASVDCTDLSADALQLAQENAERLGAKVHFRQGDLWQAAEGCYNVIVSNPPYIPTADCTTLQQEVMQEPHMALDGGNDGLDFYRRIAAEAPTHLTDNGALLCEIGHGQGEVVAALFREAGLHHVTVWPDLAGLERIVTAETPENHKG